MFGNITNPPTVEEHIAALLSLIGKPARIQIIMVICEEAACVCHLEAALGLRQASISQHLMVLRKAGVVRTHREGRNIFYALTRPDLMDVLEKAGSITGSDLSALKPLSRRPVPDCPCPQCNPGMDPKLTCVPTKALKS